MKTRFFLSLFLMILSCNTSVDTNYVKSKMWSYNGGFKVGKGDMILFDKKDKLFDMKGDTIYYDGKARAIIKNVNKKNFIMTVSSLDGKEIGTYRNTEESLQ